MCEHKIFLLVYAWFSNIVNDSASLHRLIIYTLYCKFKKCIYQNKIFFRRRSKRETNVTENIEYDDADYYDSNEGGVDAENDDTRIVNGYAAGKRPWLVLIITNNEGMCGGSLINHKYVQQNTGKFCQMLWPLLRQYRLWRFKSGDTKL